MRPFSMCARVLLCASALAFASPAAAAIPNVAFPRVIYRSPVPGARYIRPETNVILHFERKVCGLRGWSIAVTGSRSGLHDGRSFLTENSRTLLFLPRVPFEPGESVEVKTGAGSWTFAVAPQTAPLSVLGILDDDPPPVEEDPDTIPAPVVQSTIYHTPSPGRLFLSNFGSGVQPFLLIIDDHGQALFKRPMPGTCDDFKVQPNGLLTYFDGYTDKYYGLDSSYAVVDSFACGNGYTADAHELRLLPNGHAVLMSYDPQPVDMSTVVPGGNPNAIVTGLVLQELDAQKNVVFQWRSWDHFEITDAVGVDLTTARVDYAHGNAIEIDRDGNWVVSSRHMDEITKIDRQTGEILWRWGGKHNQFTLLGDTLWFSHQHAIRRIANGHFTLFDNGNLHTPRFSRAVEYEVDEAARTATLVWQYRHSPDVFGSALGYVQRLENGNTLISWGNGKPSITEVTPGGIVVMEMSLPQGQSTYRTYRQEWGPEMSAHRPSFLVLSGSAPNPFRARTEMFADLAAPADLSARVFDVSGREVRNAVRAVREGSGYRIVVDLTGRAPGVYLCQVSTAAGVQARRIVHLD